VHFNSFLVLTGEIAVGAAMKALLNDFRLSPFNVVVKSKVTGFAGSINGLQ